MPTHSPISSLLQCWASSPPLQADPSAFSGWSYSSFDWAGWVSLPSRTRFLCVSWGIWRAASLLLTQAPQEIEPHKTTPASIHVIQAGPEGGQFGLLYLEKPTNGPTNKQSSEYPDSPFAFLLNLKPAHSAFQWSLYCDSDQGFLVKPCSLYSIGRN